LKKADALKKLKWKRHIREKSSCHEKNENLLQWKYYDDQIVCAEVEKSLFEKKIEKKEGKAYNKQGASKRPNVEV